MTMVTGVSFQQDSEREHWNTYAIPVDEYRSDMTEDEAAEASTRPVRYESAPAMTARTATEFTTTCATCGRGWNWETPAAHCPWEYDHVVDEDDTDDEENDDMAQHIVYDGHAQLTNGEQYSVRTGDIKVTVYADRAGNVTVDVEGGTRAQGLTIHRNDRRVHAEGESEE